jgi:signal transduction histidine kinase
MVADAVLEALLLASGIAAVLGAYGLWLWGRSRRTQVSLAETATAAWADTAPLSAALTVEVDPDLAVSADPEKLEAMFAALFENSVEYASTGGTGVDDAAEYEGRDVAVRVVRTDDGFAVADDGPGIPPEDRERVFELGYSTRADRQGLGLGMVRTLCRAYGWTVEIEESDAGGTRVVVSDVRFDSTWETDGDGAVAATDASV